MSCLEPRPFVLFAYGGAALWATTFISLGYFLGDRWKSVLENIHQYLIGLTIAAAILGVGYLVWRKRRPPVTK